jgi:hypothetical protein
VLVIFNSAFLLWCTLKGHAQYFTNVTEQIGLQENTPQSSLGSGITVVDFDKDGWDDFFIVRAYTGVSFFHNQQGSGFELHVIYSTSDELNALVCGDYDRDGDSDVFLTARVGQNRLFRNDGWLQFTDVTTQAGVVVAGTLALCGGASWGDYNSDGWPDLYVCRYSAGDNYLFHNNGDGTFANVAQLTGTAYGHAASFQAVFLDIDFDLDQDINLIVDRIPRDALYINDGNEVFTDLGPLCGYPLNLCSMNNAVEDYDHDGDWDIYVTNEEAGGNFLFENDGALNFTNVAPEKGVQTFAACWAGVWIDAENDTWSDLYVCTENGSPTVINKFYTQVGGDFTEVENFADNHVPQISYSAAKGDFNRDGYADLIVGNNSNSPVQMYYNNGGANHSITLTLQGTVSNLDGYGAWIEYWIGNERIIRLLSGGGEVYFSQDSQRLILGAGQADVIDSLNVHWPSGIIDHFEHIPADYWFHAIEGGAEPAEWNYPAIAHLCEGESITIASSIYTTILWDHGPQTAMLVIDSTGVYCGWGVKDDGLIERIPSIEVFVEPLATIAIDVLPPDCFGGQDGIVNVTVSGVQAEVFWFDGLQGLFRDDLAAGVYPFEVLTQTACSYYNEAVVPQPDSLHLEITHADPACYGESSGIVDCSSSSGGNAPYVFSLWNEEETVFLQSETGVFEALPAGNYFTQMEDSNGCLAASAIVVDEPEPLSVSTISDDLAVAVQVTGGTPPYSISWFDGSTGIAIMLPDPGVYSVSAMDSRGCEGSVNFEIAVGVEEMAVHCLAQSFIHFMSCPGQLKRWELVELTGRLVARGSDSERPVLSSGAYLCRITLNSGYTGTIKLIVP